MTVKPLTALEVMKHQLERIQQAQAECIDSHNNIKPYMRERYIILTRDEKEYRTAIKVWNELFNTEVAQ